MKNGGVIRTLSLPVSSAFVVALLLQGCAMSVEFYKEVDSNVSIDRFDVAAKVVENNRKTYGEGSSVLYNLETGLLRHYAGEYDVSNASFLESEREIDELYTQSVSTGVGSFVLNDNLLPYEGEDFEKIYVNLFLALNYARMGKIEDAIVEARKVDLKLNEYSRKYDGKNSYKQDAFVRYVMGVLYEANGETNDAFISYKQAYEGYKGYDTLYATSCPSYLKSDLIRTAGGLGFNDDLNEYETAFGMKYAAPPKDEGTLLVLIYSGKGPVKEEVKLKVSIMDKDGTIHTFVAAVPKFRSRQGWVRSYRIDLRGDGVSEEKSSELGENVDAIAARNLDERIAMVYLKTAGRALLKFLAAEKAKKEMKKSDSALANFLTSVAVDAAYDASEKADIRVWRTLPHDIQLARLQLPEGSYTFSVSDESSQPVDSRTVTIKPGSVSVQIVPDVK
ncbi:MAG TPA: hypothetical protein PL001_09875 [Candidatus Kryptobacter bacterium]|nr:hypothetical protein [Candidatus Kryptobacter bacterium]